MPSANRVTLLRDADGDGVAETRSLFLPGLKSPFSYWGTVAATTDEMHIGRKEVELPARSNRPVLQGKDVSFLEHADDILDGLEYASSGHWEFRPTRPDFYLGLPGIAFSLGYLGDLLGEERYTRLARLALASQRRILAERPSAVIAIGAFNGWGGLIYALSEVAEVVGEERYPCSWCHGAPGIGLARTAGLPFLDDQAVRDEIRAAVETTLVEGFGRNHSLCHGDIGNLDFLVEVARVTGDEGLRVRADRIAGSILDSIETHGWLYGLSGGAEPLGLMVGLAGIAYGLARLAAPDRLPSVLSLAPPPGAAPAEMTISC